MSYHDYPYVPRKQSSMRRLLTALAISVPCAIGTVQAAIIHVPADQPSIHEGINAAVDGDTVAVAPGLYADNINFAGKHILVAGDLGAGQAELLS